MQLASVLEELDVEVSRLQLNPRARTLLSSGRDYIDKVRRIGEQLGVPGAAAQDLEDALKALQREIGDPDGAGELTPRIAEVRQVTHALRAVCIAIMAKSSRI
jgi:hypothetical protein